MANEASFNLKLFGVLSTVLTSLQMYKISLEGTSDLHSKDKTAAQRQRNTVIPQVSRAKILQWRQNSEEILHVCLCVHELTFPLPPTQCPLSLQSPVFIRPSRKFQHTNPPLPITTCCRATQNQ